MNEQFHIPAVIRGKKLRDYFMDHVVAHSTPSAYKLSGVHRIPNFYRVVKPLHVFKIANTRDRVQTRVINLIIPVGAFIYADTYVFNEGSDNSDRKMRASEAIVHSIVDCGRNLLDFWGDPARKQLHDVFTTRYLYTDTLPSNFDRLKFRNVSVAHAGHSSSFVYRVGETVRPTKEFSFEDSQCRAGIHFFMNARDALAY